MLYFDFARHDPVTGTLTVTRAAPSRAFWSVHEYRDVPVALVEELAAVSPHGEEFIRERIAPYYAVRRSNESVWHMPDPPDLEWVRIAASSGAVRSSGTV